MLFQKTLISSAVLFQIWNSNSSLFSFIFSKVVSLDGDGCGHTSSHIYSSHYLAILSFFWIRFISLANFFQAYNSFSRQYELESKRNNLKLINWGNFLIDSFREIFIGRKPHSLKFTHSLERDLLQCILRIFRRHQ